MKILFIVGKFPLLSQTFVLNQITGLIDRGHEVDIYAASSVNNSTVHSDIEKYHLLEHTYYRSSIPRSRLSRLSKGLALIAANCFKEPTTLLRSMNVLRYIASTGSTLAIYEAIPLLRRPSYDIIHCHFGPNGNRGRLLREVGVLEGKLITTFHGFDITVYLHKYGKNMYDRLFDTGDFFLPISDHWRQRLIELGCDAKKIIVHRMGVDCGKFYFKPWQLDDTDKVRIVSVARLVEKKGLEYGIRAVAKLAKINKNIEYTIVGDGHLKDYLQGLVRELDVTDTVHLVGPKPQEQVIDILDNAHILLAPSVTDKNGDQEGIPVVLMEALAMGLPVVSTQHSGIPELVENGVSGFLVPERNVEALYDKLKCLIQNPNMWSEMGRRGRNYVQEHYDINKLNDRLVQVYQGLLN
ncbi:MAG: glycosyltransferase [Actinomycetia bacterium]|nr:glycosyltransferase [Actinomycetes bacterium]